MNDDVDIRPVGQADIPAARDDKEPAPVDIDTPIRSDDDPPEREGDEPDGEGGEERRTSTDADKLKRSRAAEKRAKREAADLRAQLAALTNTVAQLAQRQGAVESHTVDRAEQDLEGRLAQARAQKRAARDAGDMDAEEAADEQIYNARQQLERVKQVKQRQAQQPRAEQGQQERSQLQMAPEAARFMERNSVWYHPDPRRAGHRQASAYAVALGHQLMQSGDYTDWDDPDLYRDVEREVQQRFPELRSQRQGQRQQTVVGSSRGGGATPRDADLSQGQRTALKRTFGDAIDTPEWRKEYGHLFQKQGGR